MITAIFTSLLSIPGVLVIEAAKSLSGGIISEPARGSILYSAIVTGVAEHSGIYVGDGQIVHLDGDGKIEAVSAVSFMARLGGLATGLSLFASCDKHGPVGSDEVADRAIAMIGKTRDYGLLTDNCHQFTAGCLTGDFENSLNFLWMLKDQTLDTLKATRWASWHFDAGRERRRFERTEKINQVRALVARTENIHAGLLALITNVENSLPREMIDGLIRSEKILREEKSKANDMIVRLQKCRASEMARNQDELEIEELLPACAAMLEHCQQRL